jgi:hypothetical protein
MTKHCMHFLSLLCLLHGHLNMDALGLSEELHKLYIFSLRSSPFPHATAKETFKKKGDLAAISTVDCPHTSAEGQHCSILFNITQSFVKLLTKAPFWSTSFFCRIQYQPTNTPYIVTILILSSHFFASTYGHG